MTLFTAVQLTITELCIMNYGEQQQNNSPHRAASLSRCGSTSWCAWCDITTSFSTHQRTTVQERHLLQHNTKDTFVKTTIKIINCAISAILKN